MDNLKLDVSEQDLKNLQQLAESAIENESDIKKLTKVVYDKCVSDREFAKAGAYICDKLAAIENKGTKFRSALLSLVQADFKSKYLMVSEGVVLKYMYQYLTAQLICAFVFSQSS